MIYAYSGIIAAILILAAVSRRYKTQYFTDLANKENPFKLLYPASARVCDFLGNIFPSSTSVKRTTLLKRLCVRENVEKENYIYHVKRTATLLGILLLSCAAGVLLCLYLNSDKSVRELERNSYGSSDAVYELEAVYDGREENVEISLEPEELSEEEILKIFDENIDAIRAEVLSDNPSWEEVSLPLNLINQYGEIKILWEIDDISSLDYNGNVSGSVKDGTIVNLKAVLSMGEVSESFMMPARLITAELSENERLTESISRAIEMSNSAYDKSVALPKSIDGKDISFRKPDPAPSYLFLILGFSGALAVLLGSDRGLEKKVKKRQEELALDFSEIVFRLNLLYSSGLSIYGAFERIVKDAEASGSPLSPAYQEMKLALEKIRSGVSETEAYCQFGRRCGLHQYIRLGTLLEQNLSKGTRGLGNLLRQEADEAFEERKRLARKKGEEAGTRMLIPMVMMLIVVIIIVAVPAMMSISF